MANELAQRDAAALPAEAKDWLSAKALRSTLRFTAATEKRALGPLGATWVDDGVPWAVVSAVSAFRKRRLTP